MILRCRPASTPPSTDRHLSQARRPVTRLTRGSRRRSSLPRSEPRSRRSPSAPSRPNGRRPDGRRRCPGTPGRPSCSSPDCRAARAASSGCGTGSRTAGRRRWHVALEDEALLADARVRVRDRRQERHACTGGAGRRRARSTVGQLDELAEVHHPDPVADVLDDRQVVGDEQVGQVELAPEVEEQVQDLALDRHVEGRHRLVADDEVRVERERPGDADPLALAAARTRAGSGGRSRAAGRPRRGSRRPACRGPSGRPSGSRRRPGRAGPRR